MQTHQIHVLGASEQVHAIRGELFRFPEVLDVFVTGRPDVLVVVYARRPRPAEWLLALRKVGYRPTARDHATWRESGQRPRLVLHTIGHRPGSTAHAGDQATSSIRHEQTPRRRRDAA